MPAEMDRCIYRLIVDASFHEAAFDREKTR